MCVQINIYIYIFIFVYSYLYIAYTYLYLNSGETPLRGAGAILSERYSGLLPAAETPFWPAAGGQNALWACCLRPKQSFGWPGRNSGWPGCYSGRPLRHSGLPGSLSG